MTTPTVKLTVEEGIENAYHTFQGGCFEFVQYIGDKKVIFEELSEDYDPMHPVVVSNHSTTTWARHCRITEDGYDWWIGIAHACTTNGTITKAHIVEAFMQMLLLETCDATFDQDVLDAMIYSYLLDDGIEFSEHEWATQMLKFNNVISVFGDTAEMFACELVNARFNAAKHSIEDAMRVLMHCGDGTDMAIRALADKYPDRRSVAVNAMMVNYQKVRNNEREARVI